MRYSFDAASIPTAKKAQSYSMLGTRGIWHDGWKAVTTHPAIRGWATSVVLRGRREPRLPAR